MVKFHWIQTGSVTFFLVKSHWIQTGFVISFIVHWHCIQTGFVIPFMVQWHLKFIGFVYGSFIAHWQWIQSQSFTAWRIKRIAKSDWIQTGLVAWRIRSNAKMRVLLYGAVPLVPDWICHLLYDALALDPGLVAMPNESGSRLDLSPSSWCSSTGCRLDLSSPLCALVLDWTENGFVAIRGSQLWRLYNFSHQGCTHGGEKKDSDCFLF